MLNLRVVILTYNGRQWIEPCLGSVLAAGVAPGDILVVDNASADGTAAMVREQFPAVQLVQNAKNLGFAGGCNVGIRLALQAGAEFVMLLNQDTRVEPDCFAKLEEAVTGEEPAGVFAPLQLTYDGSSIDPAMRKGLLVERGEYIDDLWRGQAKPTYLLDGAYGGALLLHRHVFEVVGLFDECFFLYGEDEDLCRRIRLSGFSIRLVPAALVRHWHTGVQVEAEGCQRENPHMRRATLLLALKDPQRTWASRCAYVAKVFLADLVHGLARLDVPAVRQTGQDISWFAANYSRIKTSRVADHGRRAR